MILWKENESSLFFACIPFGPNNFWALHTWAYKFVPITIGPFSLGTISLWPLTLGPLSFGTKSHLGNLTWANHNWANHYSALLTWANLTLAFDAWPPLFLDKISFWPNSLGSITILPFSLGPISLGPLIFGPLSFWTKFHLGPSHFGHYLSWVHLTWPGDFSAKGLLGLRNFGTRGFSQQRLLGQRTFWPILCYMVKEYLNCISKNIQWACDTDPFWPVSYMICIWYAT